jgi:hypothetical protein
VILLKKLEQITTIKPKFATLILIKHGKEVKMGKFFYFCIGAIVLLMAVLCGLNYWWDHTPLYQSTTKGGIEVIYRHNPFSLPIYPKLVEVKAKLNPIPGTEHSIGFTLYCPGIPYSDSTLVNKMVDSVFQLLITPGKNDSIYLYLPKPYRILTIDHSSLEGYDYFCHL